MTSLILFFREVTLTPIDPAITMHYRSLRYGLFIHFGLYSLLGGTYQGQTTPFYAEWIRHTLRIPDEDYRKLADEFRPDLFDAKEICRKAKAWGMKYVCFTAKHHDGYAMFDTKTDSFNSQYHVGRDFVAELTQAAKEQGLMFGLYYSQAQDWDHPGGISAYRDRPEEDLYQDYFQHKMLVQLEELLTNYGPIGYLWLDTPSGMSQADCLTIAQTIRQLQPDCLIGGRIGHNLGDVIITGDNRLPRLAVDKAWELPATLNSSWGYRSDDTNWRTAEDVLHQLTQVISRGGNLLLNVGPDGTGQIPPASLAVLDEVGEYLIGKEESFFSSMTLPDYPYEQSDFLMTAAPHTLYLHLLREPNQGILELYHVENQIVAVEVLGSDKQVDFFVGQDLEGHAYWRLTIPDANVRDILKVTLTEERVSISSI